ncbi:MAG: HAD-IA family hydrolase [Pseudomonadota bacterium]
MKKRALFIGSIGVLAETSDIQRRAYNTAFTEAGIDWHWDEDTYRELLKDAGGQKRLASLSDAAGGLLSDFQIKDIHARKTEIACAEVIQGVDLRPGIPETIEAALSAGVLVGLVTTTFRANIDAIVKGSNPPLPIQRFSAVLTRMDCDHPKPSAEIYEVAMQRTGVSAEDVLAIEDSAASVAAARSAGIETLITPGAFTREQDFGAGAEILASLDPALVVSRLGVDTR